MFPSSQRGHGWADPGARYFMVHTRENKFRPGGIGWKKEPVNVELWLRHLRGEMLLGLGPTLDDGTCFWGCIDIDHYGKDSRYDFNIVEIRSNAFGRYPKLIPIKSKSGGLHLFARFREQVQAARMQEALTRCMTYLDLAGNEVFPKQAVLDDKEGVSWVFMPYGDPDHCSFNETGGSITDSEFIAIFGDQYMDAGFLDIPNIMLWHFRAGAKQQANTGKFNDVWGHGSGCV